MAEVKRIGVKLLDLWGGESIFCFLSFLPLFQVFHESRNFARLLFLLMQFRMFTIKLIIVLFSISGGPVVSPMNCAECGKRSAPPTAVGRDVVLLELLLELKLLNRNTVEHKRIIKTELGVGAKKQHHRDYIVYRYSTW